MPTGPELQPSRTSVSRRDFLAVGGLSMMGLSVAEEAAVRRARERSGPRSCILIVMAGGPSQLETFDPKPDAPREVRGPLKSIATAIPGVHFSECLPRLAERANRFTVVRSLFHEAAPNHEAGLQLLQTGRLVARGEHPASVGAIISRLLGPRGAIPAHVLLPARITCTGVEAYRGDGSGFLGEAFAPALLNMSDAAIPAAASSWSPTLEPFERQSLAIQDAYGDSTCGRLFLQARQLIEHGVRLVTVNQFARLEGEITWDAHAQRKHGPGTLYDYRDSLGPQFDRACAALLDDLRQRRLLDDTLVICAGEFGRTPRLNEHGGRDHWTNAASALLSGCGLPEGAVIGATDQCGGSVTEKPVALTQLVATMYDRLKIDLSVPLPSQWPIRSLCDDAPLTDLLA